MSRVFSKNLSNYMSLGVNAVGPILNGVAKISFHCWINPVSLTSGANDNKTFTVLTSALQLALGINGSGVNKVLRVHARSVAADTLQTRDGTTNLATSTWWSVGGMVDFAGDFITPYVAGVAEGAGAVTFANNSYTHATASIADAIGTQLTTGSVPGTTANQFDGSIAEMMFWKGDIGAAGFEQLALGVWPMLVRPDLMAPYWSLNFGSNPEPELVQRLAATITGSVPLGDHPRIMY
jgi:hypothetical protein